MDTSNWRYLLSILAVGATVSCGPDTTDPDPTNGKQPNPTIGQSSFVSADGQNGQASAENEAGDQNNANNLDAAADDGAEERTAEEGDIYRVSSTDGLILNLNSYRGLQIIDFSDVTAPEIIGRAQVSGTPVEMYQVDDRVYILMNNWWGYYGSRSNIRANQYHGGLVAVVDVSDTRNPKITARAQVPGWIRTSRLTRGSGKESLYVVANDWQTDQTYVKSFSIDGDGDLITRSQIDLDGYVQDIQATGDRLMVSRWDWNGPGHSEVALIDISDPNGTMREGQSVTVEGYVSKKSDMSIEDDILRVVSGNNWSNNSNTNYVETFDASDISNVTPIDAETFGDGQSLFATIFLEDRAFFVTYEQVDPFHAFSISPDGQVVEESEFIVSGWNNFFKPVANQTRLVGIGMNDQNGGAAPAVSLYDITDLKNPNPLLDRDEMPLQWSWSEANWDDRAFSVLEGGASATSSTGVAENGLVLLPFNGWNNDSYESGVQIFTFSDSTVTKRGVMMHDTPVRRAFVADNEENVTGNMSEMELSLFDTTNTDAPTELSRVELAPNYSDFLTYGDHGVRRHDRTGYYWWWWGQSNVARNDSVQIVDLAQNPDDAEAVAELSIPADSRLFKMDDLLLVVSSEFVGDHATQDYTYLTSISVWDLSSPKTPTFRGSLSTEDLPPVWGYYDPWGFGGIEDGYYYYNYFNEQVHVVGDALVFSEYVQHEKKVGHVYVTNKYPKDRNRNWDECWDENYEPLSCTYTEGYQSCREVVRNDGTREPEVCTGGFFTCTQTDEGETDCTPLTLDDSELDTDTWDHELHRWWNQQNFHVVDISSPGQPALAGKIENATDEESVNVLVRGDKLHYTFKQPHAVQGDTRPFVKFYFRTFDLSDPGNVSTASDVNIPGELVEIDGDTLLTRDFLWGTNIIETSINRLELSGGAAYLRGIKRFEDKIVKDVLLDGAGHVLITHETAYLANYQNHGWDWDDYDQLSRLSILRATGRFDELAEVDVDNWATLQGAANGHALFQVPGGMLIMNLEDATTPYAQAFLPVRGWAQNIVIEGNEAFVAAGMFGLYRFDLDTFNLLTLP